MQIDMKVTIKMKDGRQLVMSKDVAEQLYAELGNLLNKYPAVITYPIYVPATPFQPIWVEPPNNPFIYPTITCASFVGGACL